ncbi:hypothetical protein [Nocardia sp. NPDC050406]|uniref:MmyB family transcriptional regulator n=1 Tax=Nocardia sp. NPDC050406 TaxID=3364318 RepID=UPI00379505B6
MLGSHAHPRPDHGHPEPLSGKAFAHLRLGFVRPARYLSGSARFDELWQASRSGQIRSDTKVIRHPELGRLTLDCDALQVPDSDQIVIVYSAAPGTAEATALELLRVTGSQQFSA